MSLELDWGDLDETFLVWKFTGKWTSEEYFKKLSCLDEFTRNKGWAIALVVDVRYSISSPTNLMSLVRTSLQRKFVNIDRVIVITQSNFWVRIFDIVRTTLKHDLVVPVVFVHTVDEAYQLLNQDTIDE